MIKIVIPMAGNGSRFRAAGYLDPKPFIMVDGKRMIELVIENLTPKTEHQFIFIAQREHLDCYGGYEILNNAAPGCVIVPINGVTEGAACSVLLAKDHIDCLDELLVANSDQLINFSIDDFLSDARLFDATIMTMLRNESKWSFVGKNPKGEVTRVVEKHPISEEATTGVYFFQYGSDFVSGVESMIKFNLRHNNEFYVAPVYNELIQVGKEIGTVMIPTDQFHGLGTPEDLELYLSKT